MMKTIVSTDVTTRPIVVGVVRDHRADHAIRRGWDLAALLDVPVQLVHGISDASTEGAETGAHRVLAGHIDEIVHAAADRRPSEDLRVQAGKASAVLVERARALRAGLIVLGSHRRRGRLDLGSTARTVLAHAPCAVWCQPSGPLPIERLLVPVDFSEDSLGALDQATRLARRLGASITVLHSFVPPDFAYPPTAVGGPTYVIDQSRDQVRQEFQELVQEYDWSGVPHGAFFVEGDPAQEILNVQDEADLVVMATHGRNAVASAVLGSVAQTVLRESSVPVMAVRHPARMKTP